MRLNLGAIATLGLIISAPLAAQSVGMQVVDTTGAAVGTVTAIQGDNIQVKTDKHQAMLPKTSLTVSNGKLLIGMSQAQLDAAIEKSEAAANAAIAAGATVKGAGGSSIGTIESVADRKVTITLQSGKKIAVARDGLRGNADGTVTIGLTSAQIDALVGGGPAATKSEK